MAQYSNDNLMDCSKVYLKNIEGKGASTYAKVAIKEGELVGNKSNINYYN